MFRRIFHIDLDAFFVSAEQAFRPELKGNPLSSAELNNMGNCARSSVAGNGLDP
ncbi:MAG: Y-family DNA polymerase [Dehalococcoidia bacterium]